MNEHENPYKLSVLFHATGFLFVPHHEHNFFRWSSSSSSSPFFFLVTSERHATHQDISERFFVFSLPRAMFDFGSEVRVSRIRTGLTIIYFHKYIHHESLRLKKCTNNVQYILVRLKPFSSTRVRKNVKKKKTNKHTKVNWRDSRMRTWWYSI